MPSQRSAHSCLTLMSRCQWPPEFCARGSLSDLLKTASTTPAVAAQLTWHRRLQMVRAGKGAVPCG